MKITTSKNKRGFAVLVILLLLGLLTMLMAGNAAALAGLKREMRLIEKKQMQKYQAANKPVKGDSDEPKNSDD